MKLEFQDFLKKRFRIILKYCSLESCFMRWNLGA